MPAYYNEHDPFAAAWLRELIKEGLITDGEVDTRSIADVQPGDLDGFIQCHFFAGIGGWSLALRLAGWPDDRAVWTGSCPCQPFSSAGAQAGGDDPRHLWPAWFRLIRECRPSVVFGEQVEAALTHGWLDLVCDDLEREDYAVGAVSLASPCVGAFDLRQRLWFVAESSGERCDGERLRLLAGEPRQAGIEAAGSGEAVRLADSASGRLGIDRGASWHAGHVDERKPVNFWSVAEWLPCRDGKARPVEPGTFPLAHGVPARVGRLRGYGNAIKPQVAAEVIKAYMSR